MTYIWGCLGLIGLAASGFACRKTPTLESLPREKSTQKTHADHVVRGSSVSATVRVADASADGASQTVDDQSWLEGVREAAADTAVFLLRKRNGVVVARTIDGRETPLVPERADAVVLDPTLDLVWMYAGTRLSVVDLRQLKPKVLPIASSLPEMANLNIMVTAASDARIVAPASACDTGSLVSLTWSHPPKLEVISESGEVGKLVGRKWLTDQIGRVPRSVELQQKTFDTASEVVPVPLPNEVGKCADPEDCGGGLAFGMASWLLVRIEAQEGADCFHSACLLYDPGSRKFATPSAPKVWTTAEAAKPGDCGPFAFDPSGRIYLTNDSVCTTEKGCAPVPGEPVGWLDPGVVVGVP